MKYKVAHWGDSNTNGVNNITILPATLSPKSLDMFQQTVVFPCAYDEAKTEQAIMLATKLCAFMNELEEKKRMVVELMDIAGSKG